MPRLRRDPSVLPTPASLHDILLYDPAGGTLRWKNNGKKATFKIDRGYEKLNYDYRQYYAHIVIWAMMKGEWPTFELDHEDTDKGNNKWVNIRPATPSQNRCNRGPSRINTSGYKGVWWHKIGKKWCATVHFKGKRYYLGLFADPKEAHMAYCAKAKEIHGDFYRDEPTLTPDIRAIKSEAARFSAS